MNYTVSTDRLSINQMNLRVPQISLRDLKDYNYSNWRTKRILKKINRKIAQLNSATSERDIFKIELEIKKLKMAVEDLEI